MVDHTATVLAFIRTPAGIVKVDCGERVPNDALPTEITRLVEAGAIAESESHQEAAPSGDALEVSAPAPKTRRSRGQSGTKKED